MFSFILGLFHNLIRPINKPSISFQMPPNNSVEKNPLSPQNLEQTSKMNTVLSSSSSRAFHRTDLAETSTSLSIHSNGIHDVNSADDPPQFNYERERLKSFENWPVSFLSPSVMAAAGFYFLKREDVVRCAFCGVEVGCWVEGDDPMQDHERWSPSCRFVRKLPVANVPLNINPTNNNSATDVPKENGKHHFTIVVVLFCVINLKIINFHLFY